jgi:hypothetical protein
MCKIAFFRENPIIMSSRRIGIPNFDEKKMQKANQKKGQQVDACLSIYENWVS